MAGTIEQLVEEMNDAYTTTWRLMQKEVQDQVFQITPFYDMMYQKGKIREDDTGGRTFDVPVQYDELNQNTDWITRGGTVGMSEKEFLTQLSYDKKTLVTAIPRYYEDDVRNRGKAQRINYINQKLENTKSSLVNTLENDTWTQNANAASMTALPSIISTTPTTGTIGGLTRASQGWMVNQTKSMTGEAIIANLLNNMRNMFHNCSKYKAGTRAAPDIIICDQTTYELYEQLAESLQQIVAHDSPRVSLGFGNMLFKGVEIYWAPQCPAQTMYFLNTEHLALRVESGVFMEMTPWKTIPNSLDSICQIVTMCNLTCDNFQKQGVIYNIPTTFS